MEISVVIPVHNEAGSIEDVVRETDTTLKGRVDYEILCVDDGSTDGSGAIMRAMERDGFSSMRVLAHEHRFGKSVALYTGIAAARFSWITMLDGDGQNHPDDILLLLENLKKSPEPAKVHLVNGVRRQRWDSFSKRFFSKAANHILSLTLECPMIDAGCGLKLLRRDVFLSLPRLNSVHRYLPALIHHGGGGVLWVDVGHSPRTKGRSKYGIFDRVFGGMLDFLKVHWLIRRTRPVVTETDRNGNRSKNCSAESYRKAGKTKGFSA